ncbi:MAG: sulfate ABC transporter substrate-binding protein, partial [Chloroflexota bacterium]
MLPMHDRCLSRRRLTASVLTTAGLAILPGFTRPRFARADESILTLVAYSTPREAYEALIPIFQASEAGTGVVFDQSYGASGDQSRAVVDGKPAD